MKRKSDPAELIEAYALGCLTPDETDVLIEYLTNNEEHPWRELGEYQNLASLLPSFLDIDPPPKKYITAFREKLAAVKQNVKMSRKTTVSFPPIADEKEEGLRPQTIIKDPGTLKEQEDLRSKSGDDQESREQNTRGSSKTQIRERDKDRNQRNIERSGKDAHMQDKRNAGLDRSAEKHSVKEDANREPHSEDDVITREHKANTETGKDKNNSARITSEIHKASKTGGKTDTRIPQDIVTKISDSPGKSGIPEHTAKHVHSEKRIDHDEKSPKVTRTDFSSKRPVQFKTTREEISDERFADKKKWQVNKTPHGSMVTLQRDKMPEKKRKRTDHSVKGQPAAQGDAYTGKFTALWIVIGFLIAALIALYFVMDARISELETILKSRGLLP
jgi:hypothetical protein